jgi:hypothetical protein
VALSLFARLFLRETPHGKPLPPFDAASARELRDERVVVLRDAQNRQAVLATRHVEVLQPSRLSLMPAGQLAGLIAQQAADLLGNLANRK